MLSNISNEIEISPYSSKTLKDKIYKSFEIYRTKNIFKLYDLYGNKHKVPTGIYLVFVVFQINRKRSKLFVGKTFVFMLEEQEKEVSVPIR